MRAPQLPNSKGTQNEYRPRISHLSFSPRTVRIACTQPLLSSVCHHAAVLLLSAAHPPAIIGCAAAFNLLLLDSEAQGYHLGNLNHTTNLPGAAIVSFTEIRPTPGLLDVVEPTRSHSSLAHPPPATEDLWLPAVQRNWTDTIS
mmetsp:Transcript_5628/g.11753  ORF Transcript_5628/g.11753 Transcript_5628/m.11753 type:complete len:144 (+) Transcript_5628:1350-1781(+)